MSKDVFRLAAFSALLLAGSCAAPGPDNNAVTTVDPDRLHPITVQPDYRVAKVSYLGGGSLAPEDSAKLDRVVQDYLGRGDGSLSVSVPAGRSGRTMYRCSAVLSQTRTSTSSDNTVPNSRSTPRGSMTARDR